MSEKQTTGQFKKGHKGGPGRPAGLPNKATIQARQAIARFVDCNTERMQEWLDAVAKDEKQGPTVAFKMLMDVMEYHVPKLARTEMVGEGGGKIQFEVSAPWLKSPIQDRN